MATRRHGQTPGMDVRCVFFVRVRQAHVKLYRVVIWSDQWLWLLPVAASTVVYDAGKATGSDKRCGW
jgi:hypothetical protein